jgi:hypothetical protein
MAPIKGTSHRQASLLLHRIRAFDLIFLLVFSGGRLRFIDGYGRRTDLVASLLLFGSFILVNSLARRRVLPKIELYYEPMPYDERKIFFDLGQGSQHVTTIDQLYQHLADRIRNELEACNAAIFIRDDATGNFNLRVLSTQGRARRLIRWCASAVKQARIRRAPSGESLNTTRN